jgi:HEAT repeat protein
MKTTYMAVLTLLGLLTVNTGVGQQTQMSMILSHLQDPEMSDAAVVEIAAGSPDLKKIIADKLPSLMLEQKNYVVLNNESRLAGDLKVIACIPVLVTIFVEGDLLPNALTGMMRFRMDNDPAGRALAQIGDPVIPSMKKLLSSGDRDVREKAVRVLANINSPSALEVLKEHRGSESDPYLQDIIDRYTAPKN